MLYAPPFPPVTYLSRIIPEAARISAVRIVTIINGGFDALPAQRFSEHNAVISLVCPQSFWPPSTVSDPQSVNRGKGGSRIVDIRFGGRCCQRYAVAVGQNAPFQAVFLLVSRVANLIRTPLLFCRVEVSRYAFVRLIFLLRFNSIRRVPAMAFQGPAFRHCANRFQHVFPDPYRSGGRSSQRHLAERA